jgi:hypothetical protein
MDKASCEFPPQLFCDEKREDRREMETKGQGKMCLLRREGGEHVHLLRKPREGREKGTAVAQATTLTGAQDAEEKTGEGPWR